MEQASAQQPSPPITPPVPPITRAWPKLAQYLSVVDALAAAQASKAWHDAVTDASPWAPRRIDEAQAAVAARRRVGWLVGGAGLRATAGAPRHGVGDGAVKGGEAMPDGSAVHVKPGKLKMLPGLGMMGVGGGPDAIRPAQKNAAWGPARHRNSQQ